MYIVSKHIDVQIQEAQQTPRRIKPKKTKPKHILVKLLKSKDEENVLKAAGAGVGGGGGGEGGETHYRQENSSANYG